MKGRNKKLSTIELDTIRELGENGNISVREIAKIVGIGTTSVKKYLHSMDISLPGHILRGPEIIDSEYWRCKNCNEVRDVDDFLWIDSVKKNHRQTHCKHCMYDQTNKRLNGLESFLKLKVSSLKCTANKNHLLFDLSWIYLSTLLEQQKRKCFYTDVDLVWGRGHKQTDSRFRATVDKIEPSKGYVIGNVVWCSRRANIIKSDLTLDEMKLWMPGWWDRIRVFKETSKCQS